MKEQLALIVASAQAALVVAFFALLMYVDGSED